MQAYARPNSERIASGLGRNRSFFLLVTVILITMTAIGEVLPYKTIHAHNKPLGPRPWPTESAYMWTVNTALVREEGCAQGRRSTYDPNNYQPEIARPYNGTVVLTFGRPHRRRTDGAYGTILYGDTFASMYDIEQAVKAYALGFWYCTPSIPQNPPLLRIGVGTTNNQLDDLTANNNTDPYTHGRLWGEMVNNIRNYVNSQGMQVQLTVAGSNDIEIGWSAPARVRLWLAGFALSGRTYHNFGDAAGCYPAPGTTNPPTDVCRRYANGTPMWRQEDVWYVSRGASGARALPQIYYGGATIPPDVNARQWQKLSLFGYAYHGGEIGKIIFAGEMTQSLSCGNCHNWPEEGWTQLQNTLYNFDPSYHGTDPGQNWCQAPPSCHRTDQYVGWSTDIKNYNP